MNLAIVGCGYVANMYRLTLTDYENLSLKGVFDSERCRSENLALLTGTRCYATFQEVLDDPAIDCVLNLTNPESHYDISMQSLKAGKHVYTEKPLAMDFRQALELAAYAKDKKLMLLSAPCTLLNSVAQTTWKALCSGVVGPVRLVYAEMEDGMVPRSPYKHWINSASVAWPAVNEFETGCTIEHAGYVLTWLAAFFGPAQSVTSFSDTILPDKIPGQQIAAAADFSVAAIRFSDGVIARMTNGLYAQHDHSLRFFCDEGVITVVDPRSDQSPVLLQKYKSIRRKRFLSPWKTNLNPAGSRFRVKFQFGKRRQIRDFCRLIGEMDIALLEGREPYVTEDFSVHITEISLACQNAAKLEEEGRMPYKTTTTFRRIEPFYE